jgi:integrase
MTGQGDYVFPAVDSVRRPMSNNTLNPALRRLGYLKEEVSVSGFRATASTLLNEMGRWNPDAIERQLAHMEENDVRRAYMHAAEFWNERVEMIRSGPIVSISFDMGRTKTFDRWLALKPEMEVCSPLSAKRDKCLAEGSRI